MNNNLDAVIYFPADSFLPEEEKKKKTLAGSAKLA